MIFIADKPPAADLEDVKEFLTAVMRNKLQLDDDIKPPTISERIKCTDMLLKIYIQEHKLTEDDYVISFEHDYQ